MRVDCFISRCTRSERCITRSLSLSLSYIALRSTLPPVHASLVVPWRDAKKNRVVVRFSSPRGNPVLDQILCGGLARFYFPKSSPIRSNRISVEKVLRGWYICMVSHHKWNIERIISMILQNKKIRASSKDCPIILLAADDGQRIVRVYVPLASIVLPLFSLTYSLLLESFDL